MFWEYIVCEHLVNFVVRYTGYPKHAAHLRALYYMGLSQPEERTGFNLQTRSRQSSRSSDPSYQQ